MNQTRISQAARYPIVPATMAKACRVMAAAYRQDAARGLPDVYMHDLSRRSCLGVAKSLELQAAAWDARAASRVCRGICVDSACPYGPNDG